MSRPNPGASRAGRAGRSVTDTPRSLARSRRPVCPTRLGHSVGMRVLVAWALAAACAGWAALRLLGLERGFPLVPLVAYTPFVAAGAAAVVVIAVLLRQRAAALVAFVVAVALAATVAPRALGGPSEPEGDPGPPLRVLTREHAPRPRLSGVARGAHPLDARRRAEPAGADAGPRAAARRRRARRADAALRAARAGRRGRDRAVRAVPLDQAPGPPGTRSRWSRRGRARAAGRRSSSSPSTRRRRSATASARGAATCARCRRPSGGRLRILAGDFNATLDHAELRRVIDRRLRGRAVDGRGRAAADVAGRAQDPAAGDDRPRAGRRARRRPRGVVHTIPGTDHRAVLAELELPRGRDDRADPVPSRPGPHRRRPGVRRRAARRGARRPRTRPL